MTTLLIKATVATTATLGGLVITLPAFALSLDFSTWTPLGDVSQTPGTANITNAKPGDNLDDQPPVAGNFNLTGNLPVLGANLAAFLGVSPTSLNIGGSAIEGSAIKTLLNVNAGDVFSFNFDFGSNEPAYFGSAYPDYAFLTVNGQLLQLAGIGNTSTGATSALPFFAKTGLQSYSYTFATAGIYTLGLGVVDIDPVTTPGLVPGAVSSGLFVSNGNITPVPTPALLPGLVGMGIAAWRKRKSEPSELVTETAEA
jgi:hypothetical protein